MCGLDGNEEVPRGELTRAGWRQGSLFSVSSFLSSIRDQGGDPDDYADLRDLNDDNPLVVISHDCDIEAVSKTEPFIEILVCRKVSDNNILRAAQRNSSRVFLINSEHNLVAYAIDRFQIDKHLLRSVSPQPWPGSKEHLNRFRRWLARRYDRPAIPDPIVEHFQRPMNRCVRRLEGKPIMKLFSKVVNEMRISIPSREHPPFNIHVLLVTDSMTISNDESKAVEQVMNKIKEALDLAKVVLEDWSLRHPEEISLAEYFATRPLLYDYLTYSGEELVGAEPLSEK